MTIANVLLSYNVNAIKKRCRKSLTFRTVGLVPVEIQDIDNMIPYLTFTNVENKKTVFFRKPDDDHTYKEIGSIKDFEKSLQDLLLMPEDGPGQKAIKNKKILNEIRRIMGAEGGNIPVFDVEGNNEYKTYISDDKHKNISHMEGFLDKLCVCNGKLYQMTEEPMLIIKCQHDIYDEYIVYIELLNQEDEDIQDIYRMNVEAEEFIDKTDVFFTSQLSQIFSQLEYLKEHLNKRFFYFEDIKEISVLNPRESLTESEMIKISECIKATCNQIRKYLFDDTCVHECSEQELETIISLNDIQDNISEIHNIDDMYGYIKEFCKIVENYNPKNTCYEMDRIKERVAYLHNLYNGEQQIKTLSFSNSTFQQTPHELTIERRMS